MISFYPGPSQIDSAVRVALNKALRTSILSDNHRSKNFVNLYKETVQTIRKKLSLPTNYTVLFSSSATECWQIISQSLIGNDNSLHIYNGAFGEKWFQYTNKITNRAQACTFHVNELPPTNQLTKSPIICFTHNETSNGTYWPENSVKQLRKNFPDSLLVADATSSLAGIRINFKQADVWFASVQKCFGIPAGLAVIFLSPQAAERAIAINNTMHYNSLSFMLEMAAKNQTTHTPNVLGIYLLKEVLNKRESIRNIDKQTRTRMKKWLAYLEKSKTCTTYVSKQMVQSPTVLCVEAQPGIVADIKKQAAKKGYTLGEGYGALKETTLRIANFPAHTERHISGLQKVLDKLIR
jgi:phosphoserine aminotransferase